MKSVYAAQPHLPWWNQDFTILHKLHETHENAFISSTQMPLKHALNRKKNSPYDTN